MKIKCVPVACAVFAAICATSAFAFADTAPAELSANDLLAAPNDAVAADGAKDAASDDKNAETGAEGISAVVGAIALAGAAVVISRKKA